ncbi:DUF305 domain-containing protein [Brachyspira sp. SAP_772]|uniref:DUF305 domain-containing protein n=1 Tax=Brachyspira sp. SAP_772 TaxID=2608385 RepID=UPI0012F4EB65|nr:DUF305 domain-containing protein [Brachyspira sp. SAP_772]
MKIFLTLITIIMMLVFTVSCTQKTDSENNIAQNNTAENAHNAHAAHNASGSKIIDAMHAPMMAQAFEKTKNIDVDFLVNMIPHHQGAIDSSKILLETTTNETLKTLANNIIKAQEKEIEEFKALVEELKAKNTDYSDIDTVAFGNEAEKIMNDMMMEMSMIEVTADNDIDFLKGMIPHHQAAVDASKQILSYTKDDKIKEIANRIITDQEKEIADMNNLLTSLTSK